jgi:hypothetical protein
MDERGQRGAGRQRRRRGTCDDVRRGTGTGRSGADARSTGPVVTRTFLALAAATAQDLTDRDGVARPLLRRGALRLTGSTRAPAQRLGASYLRIDPPTRRSSRARCGPRRTQSARRPSRARGSSRRSKMRGSSRSREPRPSQSERVKARRRVEPSSGAPVPWAYARNHGEGRWRDRRLSVRSAACRA